MDHNDTAITDREPAADIDITDSTIAATPVADSPSSPTPGGGNHEDAVDFASYVFPNTAQRRYTAWGLAIVGVLAIATAIIGRGSIIIATNGLLVGGVILCSIAAYFFASAFKMAFDQGEALIIATREIGFAVGHASAVLGWRGLRARPAWRILLYSVEDPPRRRGLVELDAITGAILGAYSEDNPEDWDSLLRDEDERAG